MPLDAPGQLRIGDALIAARARADLDLKQVEARTKIREKYLRALEEEDWDELPSASHAKGFLRTYAELLGLDAVLLVDEYRRQVETANEPVAGPLSDRLLERRRGPTGQPQGPRPLLVVAAIAAVVVAALVTIGLVGDDEGEPVERPQPERDQSRDGGAGAAGGKETVRLRLSVAAPVEICLVGGEGNPLIDAQVLQAGTREEFRGRRFSLRFPSGYERSELRVRLGSERVDLPDGEGPAAFEITPPARVREASPPGRRCP